MIRQGINDFLPFSKLLMFSADEIRSLISGIGDQGLDVQEWKKLTTYEGYNKDSVYFFPLKFHPKSRNLNSLVIIIEINSLVLGAHGRK